MAQRSRARTIARRVGFTIGGLFALFLVLGIIGAIVGPVPLDTAASSRPTSASTPSTTATPVATTPPTVALPPPPPAPVAQPVARVIDGDTFVIGTDTIRVLGIDSCEAATDAGPAATATATSLLTQPVVLTSEPGVDRDRYGRALRYVRVADGQDFATAMVRETHTGVYAGRNDANADYVAALQAADPNGRTCDLPDPPPVQQPHEPDRDTYVNTPDPDAYEPAAPAPKRRTGNSGHPCLPGERDGDKDGYCGEG